MEKSKRIIAIIYLILLSIFLYFLFSKFDIHQITSSYDFIKSYNSTFINYRESNMFLVSIAFITFGVLWIVLQGFGSPLPLAAGFLFGVYFGTAISVLTLSLGASFSYIIANFFFKDLIKEKFANRFKFLEEKIKSNEFLVILILRNISGIPFQIANLLPVLFNFKLKIYFFATLLGSVPIAFILVSLGAGLQSQINNNIEPPSFLELITSFEIYGPIIAFFFLLLLAFLLRKIFYKN